MTEDEPEAGFLAELSLTDEEEGGGRAECAACLRPASACWCRHLPRPRLVTRTRVLVLQHPGEVRRNIRTCRMLELGLAEGCVQVVRGMKRNHDLNHPNCSCRNMLASFQVEGFLVKARSWRTRCPSAARVSCTRAETPSPWPRARLLMVTGTRGEWTPWSFWTVPGTRLRSYTSGIVLVSEREACFLTQYFQPESVSAATEEGSRVRGGPERVHRADPARGRLPLHPGGRGPQPRGAGGQARHRGAAGGASGGHVQHPDPARGRHPREQRHQDHQAREQPISEEEAAVQTISFQIINTFLILADLKKTMCLNIIERLVNRNITEVVQKIFLLLDVKSLHKSRRVCKQWNALIKDLIWGTRKGRMMMEKKRMHR